MLADAQMLPACTFAAQTMRRKMVRDFREIDSADYMNFREFLLNHLWCVFIFQTF